MKIVILDKKTITDGDISLKEIEKLGDTSSFDLLPEDQAVEKAKDADIILCNKIHITKEFIKACKNLKYIGLFATGFNNVDLAAAKEAGIIVCNVPEYSTDAVAQHTFALLLEMTNQVGKYNTSVKQKEWEHSDTFSYFPYSIIELNQLVMGIVGFGNIGRKTAEIAKAFGLKVIVYTRTKKEMAGITFVTLDELLEQSDIISLHCPLNENTEGMIGREEFIKMKQSAILVNTARGALIKEELREALESGRIAGAALDVLEKEPMQENNPLRLLSNCIITPHVAWVPKQTRERLVSVAAENISQFLNGTPIHVVNK